MEHISEIPENIEKGLQAIPADSWPPHGVKGLQVSHLFSRSCCVRSTSICEFKFDQQMGSVANDQTKVLQFAAFHDHGWGYVALYP